MEIDDQSSDHLDALNVTEVLDKSSNNIHVTNNLAARNAAQNAVSNPSDSNPTPTAKTVSSSGETNHSAAPSETRNSKPKDKARLKIGSLNICGGLVSTRKKKGKEELLLDTITRNNLDICCVQETELEHFNDSKPFSLKGFKTFFPKKRSEENIKRLLLLI